MKILHVYKTYYPDSFGGIPETIRQLANGMQAYDFESGVFCLSATPRKNRFKYKNHHVFQCKTDLELFSTPFSAKAFAIFKDISRKYDLIHYHYPYPFGDLIKRLSGVKKPSIVTYHSDIVRQQVTKLVYWPLQEYFLNSVQRIVCTSDAYKFSSKNLQRHSGKTVSISLGLDAGLVLEPTEAAINDWQNRLPQNFILYL